MATRNRKMLLWHSFFSYLHLTFRRGIIVPRGKERESQLLFYLRGSCLSFCKGLLLSFPIWKCRTIWEGKADLIFSLHSLTPHPLKEREQTKQQDSRSFCPQIRLRFSGRKTTVIVVFPTVLCTLSCVCSLIRCWYETLLVVFVWVLRSCLIIISSCAFYGYWWFSQCVVFFMFKKPRILMCFLVVGLDLYVVVDYVYVYPLCLVCYACMQNIGLLLCFGFSVSMFSSITYANDILITERSLRDGFSVRSFIMWYIFFEIIEQTTYLN